MNPCIPTHKFSVRSFNHFVGKALLRVFLRWRYAGVPLRIKNHTHLPKQESPCRDNGDEQSSCSPVKQASRMSPSSAKGIRVEYSPRNTSLRLFNQAQEIENHKNEIRKSLIPEYSFTPKLSSGTQKWLNSKSKKDLKNYQEEVAVVSGSKVLNFTNFAPSFKEITEVRTGETEKSAIPKTTSRIFKNRSERRSDIIPMLYPSSDKCKAVLNKSNGKF